jgi:hypothetical protein
MHFSLPKIIIAILASILLTNVLVSGTAVNNNSAAQDAVPSGWRKIDAERKFTFYLPPNMRDTGIRGIENFHKEYTTGRMYLTFDYEPFGFLAYQNRAIAFGKGFKETELLIDGRKSYLFIYQDKDWKNRRTYDAKLYVGDLPNGDVILEMAVSSRYPQAVETAKTIFSTIKFPSR